MRAMQGNFVPVGLAFLIVAVILLIAAAPAFAQWRYYGGYYSAYPPYTYPAYPRAYGYPGDPPPAPNYRGRPYAYGAPFYEDPYGSGPRGQSYGSAISNSASISTRKPPRWCKTQPVSRPARS